MFITHHARERLVARLGPARANIIIGVLEMTPGSSDHRAIEVMREKNGDRLVVIAREGSVETVMLRRSTDQPFTPVALGVDVCIALPEDDPSVEHVGVYTGGY